MNNNEQAISLHDKIAAERKGWAHTLGIEYYTYCSVCGQGEVNRSTHHIETQQ